MKRRIVAMLCVLCLVCTLIPASFAASDISGHWAQSDMQLLSRLGVMKGYPDGSFKPNNSITKAEYITLLNRVFGLKATKNVTASDLSSSKWYYNDILKAEAAGYLFNFNGKISPDNKLTREEAAAMFGRLLALPTSASVTSFADDKSISSWAKPYIPAVAAAKIINGYPDGTFHPTETITRAEVARVLNNVCGTFFGSAGTYTSIDSSKANAIVMVSGVTLSGLNIPGNLYIAGGVGAGTVTLHNCSIGGEIIAFGDPGAALRFTGTTTAAAVDADGLGIVVDGVVNNLTVSADTSRPSVSISAAGSVNTLTMKTAGTIVGAVKDLNVQANGVTASVLPDKWTLTPGLSVTLAGRVYNVSGTKGPGFADGYPKAEIRQASSGLAQEIVLTVKLAQAGNVYAMAVPSGSAAPTDAQVKAMANYGMVTVAGYTFTPVTTPSMELNLTIQNLPLGGSYDVYVVAESVGADAKLGSAVKLSPGVQLMAAGYPKVSSMGDNSVTVAVKTLAQAQVYMMAVPTGSAAPTAVQLYAQSGVNGAVATQAAVAGGTEAQLTLSGLVKGTAAYDLYVGAAAKGAAAITTEISKFTLASTGNAVTVEYSTNATGGFYPGYTSLTLRFHDTMYKAGTTLQLGTVGAELSSLILVTGTNLSTGAVNYITGYTVIDAGSGSVIITPPSGGWAGGMKYTVSLRNIADAAGRNPIPSEISFNVGTGSSVAAPRFSVATGSIVSPGTTITVNSDTPNAVIQYTVDGSDPVTGSFLSGAGTSLALQIPDNAIIGKQYHFRAVARLDTAYSEIIDVVYTVGESDFAPIVTRADTGALLKTTGEMLLNGTGINILSLDPNAVCYYTIDGSTPVASGVGQKNVQLIINGQIGEKRTIKILMVSGSRQSQVYTYEFTVGTANTASVLQTPVVLVGSNTTAAVSGASYNVTGTDSLKVYSFNDYRTVKLYYTPDGSKPVTSATRSEMAATTASTVSVWPLTNLAVGQPRVISFVAYDGISYSGVVTLTLTRIS